MNFADSSNSKIVKCCRNQEYRRSYNLRGLGLAQHSNYSIRTQLREMACIQLCSMIKASTSLECPELGVFLAIIVGLHSQSGKFLGDLRVWFVTIRNYISYKKKKKNENQKVIRMRKRPYAYEAFRTLSNITIIETMTHTYYPTLSGWQVTHRFNIMGLRSTW